MSAKKQNIVKKNIKKQLDILSKKYNITGKDKDYFMASFNYNKPIRKKTILTYEQQCKARKQDGTQCSRRHKANEMFCGKHIKNQKYGIYQLKGTTKPVTEKINNIENYMKPVTSKTKLAKTKSKNITSTNSTKHKNTASKKKGKRGRKPKQVSKQENVQEFLTLKSVQIQNKYYYIDKFNILYNPEPINGQYEVIGKLKDSANSEIYYTTSLS